MKNVLNQQRGEDQLPGKENVEEENVQEVVPDHQKGVIVQGQNHQGEGGRYLQGEEPYQEETLETMSEEDKEMYKIMGFVNFDTTKGKKTAESTNADAAQILEKRKYRQYMNRRGGFNRPLDFIA
ncbi:hypothetical protein BSL78_04484 [Apostichopus japonicus]|uniref:U4/U6.U5 small nuclear ribonucleoprotein 27 kDa protein n=1 Tax=Stichopus japonicus TaxID=307972 RepID=A0A2G8LE82_STIJA|nr:hypothetical protein BSL78_04484 [Apostichopus japonicus]